MTERHPAYEVRGTNRPAGSFIPVNEVLRLIVDQAHVSRPGVQHVRRFTRIESNATPQPIPGFD